VILGFAETISPIFQQEARNVRLPGGQSGVEGGGKVRKAKTVRAAVRLADLRFAQRVDKEVRLSLHRLGSEGAGGALPAAT